MLQPFGSENLDSAQSKGQGEETHFHSLPCAAIAERFALLVDASTRCLLIAVQVGKEICQHIFKTGVIVQGVSDHVLLSLRSLIRAGLDLCL